MRRQNCISPETCCCYCNNHQVDQSQADEYGEDLNPQFRNDYRKSNGNKRQPANLTYCNEEQIDEETMQTFTSMRQKACRFIAEESECSSDSSDSVERHCTCNNQSNAEREEDIVRRANESIDYAPQSEFLQKFKRHIQCQCLNNCEQQESLSNSNEFLPRICEECITKSNEIIRLLEQLNGRGVSTLNESSEQCKPCQCGQEESQNTSGIKRIVKTCRSVVDGLKSVLTSMGPYMNGECYNGNGNAIEFHNVGDNSLSKRSQHVSRPKTRAKCRDRKKRNDSEKCLSQDRFEPSLKKPHENSCERCWRYASPSRSPVNKPAQRFDPNFRRAHSFHDFMSTEGTQSEMNRSALTTPERTPISISKQGNQLVQCRPQGSEYGSTRVKELLLENSNLSSPRNVQHRDEVVFREPYDRKLRPQTCIQGCRSDRSRRLCQFEEVDSKPLRSDKSPNSSYVRERTYPPVEKPKSAEERGTPTKAQKKFSSNYESRLNKNNTNKNSPAVGKPSRKSPNFASSHLTNCGKCTCNKTPTPRNNLPKYSPKPSTSKSPGRESLGSPVHLDSPQSSPFLENRCRTSSEKRPRTSEYDAQRSPNVRSHIQSPVTGKPYMKEVAQNGETKCCTCQSQPVRPPTATKKPNDPKCCHCHSRRNSPEQMNEYNWSSSMPPVHATPQSQLYMNGYNNCYNDNNAECGRSYDAYQNMQEDYNSEFLQNHPGKRVPCPHLPNSGGYQECQNNENNYQNNQGWHSGGKEIHHSPNRRISPARDQNANHNTYGSPKKYCVFYMTKSKNDNEKDVEVLVEELTERCRTNNNDSKMTALKEKMKRLDDCPLESMALRFQKGVNETSKNLRPESGRILYF